MQRGLQRASRKLLPLRVHGLLWCTLPHALRLFGWLSRQGYMWPRRVLSRGHVDGSRAALPDREMGRFHWPVDGVRLQSMRCTRGVLLPERVEQQLRCTLRIWSLLHGHHGGTHSLP